MQEFALCVIPIAFLVAIFGTIVALRWFKHREIMAMVDRGVVPEQYAQGMARAWRPKGRALMGWGIALAALGLALMIGLWPLGFNRPGTTTRYPLNFGPWMLVGLIPLFCGVALLIIYFVVRKEEMSAPEPAPSLEQARSPELALSPQELPEPLEEEPPASAD